MSEINLGYNPSNNYNKEVKKEQPKQPASDLPTAEAAGTIASAGLYTPAPASAETAGTIANGGGGGSSSSGSFTAMA